MERLEIRELECFLVLAEELHFGRTGERLYVSQGRVSQLLRSLERRIGGGLVERSSRRVRLTPLGERFLTGLRPAYRELSDAVADAVADARGFEGELRIGFQGTADERVTDAIDLFQRRHPGCVTEIVEIPLCDPFGPVRSAEVDVAVVLLPVDEPGLVLGTVFSAHQQTLAIPARHPMSDRATLCAEDLAELPLIGFGGPAPEYWRRAQAPVSTPGGRPVPAGPAVRSLQEGLTLVAAGRGAMLLCRPTASSYNRSNIRFVPVTGLPASRLGLVWHRDHETARSRAFARALTDAAA
ncbi:LysR family transcriptional regulator [Saccharopolyspora erythraea]|uniref:LysR family transcriptional regulator n=1 Tax=Saccharopolyspora erythraea TaxID=1836 RepID=UPI001BA9FFDF|nr:LysR family transcriptional regulator [Saccharopolyspora erythraea]QUH00760.1 LysR family transcriptional regulator [Saccharopolyspora erythraea]